MGLDRLTRRRMLGWLGAGSALSLLPGGPARADRSTELRNLRWDQRLAEENWRRKGGPLWVVHDDVPMYWGGGRALPYRRPGLTAPLTAAERGEIQASLSAASAYFKGRGLWTPKLPLGDGNAFHIFYVDAPEGVMGGTGHGAGDPLNEFGIGRKLRNEAIKWEVFLSDPEKLKTKPDTTEREVPDGVHLMMSGPMLRVYRQPPHNDHPWAPQQTLAHEMIHAIDQYAPGMTTWGKVMGWCGEGSTHAIAQFALRKLGHDPVKSYTKGIRNVLKDIGARPYDVTLTLSEVPGRIPEFLAEETRANGEKESERAKRFWTENATYLTCSFWRFLMQEEAPVRRVSAPLLPQGQVAPYLPGQAARGPAPTVPGDFEMFAPFRSFRMIGEDRARAAANKRWIDPVLTLLDRFLRTHPHPVWGATGLYRSFPAFIAHFVEWPDQIAKSRKGYLAHDKWLGALFMDGVPLLEIGPGQDIVHEPAMIPPLAARALRFKVPAIEGMTADLLENDYPMVTITVTALNGPADAIDHIHVGLRGGVLANHLSQPVRSGQGRVRRWINVDARPLFRGRTRGETVLTLINSAPRPEQGRPLKLRVHIAVQVGSANGQCSYHPLPVPNQNGHMVTIPSSVSPPTGRQAPTLAVERGIDDIEISIVQDADLVELIGIASLSSTGTGLEIQRDSDGRAAGLASVDTAGLQARAARVATVTTKSRLIITLLLPRVEPGTLGAVSGARVRAEWIDPAYRPYASLGVPEAVSMETDAVQVMLTSNSEGSLIGTYAANFDAASDNPDRAFRGRISGKFSMGIVKDEAGADGELPKDKTAIMPTDFFIAAARAGFDAAMIGRMLDQAASGAAGGAGEAEPDSGDAGQRNDQGSSQLLGTRPCTFRDEAEVREYLDLFLKRNLAGAPGVSPAHLAELRRSYLQDPQGLRMMLCEAGFFPGSGK